MTAPLRTPYVVFLVLLALSVVALAASPETVAAHAGRANYRPRGVRIAGTNRLAVAVAAIAAFAAFAVFGLFASLAPSFVAGTLHHPSRLLAGATVFVVFGAAAAAQVVSGRRSPRAQFGSGLIAQAAGLIVVAAGMTGASLPLFLIGGAIAGAGAGILLKWAIGTIAASAPVSQRGESLAGLFLIGYLGLVVPVLGLGVATRYLASTTSMLWFTGILLALLGGIALFDRRARRL